MTSPCKTAAADRRRGIALVVVLLALTMLGLMASASFFIAFHEQKSGAAAVSLLQATAMADGAVDSLVLAWNSAAFDRLGVGDSVRFGGSGGGPGTLQGTVTRTGQSFFVIKATVVLGAVRYSSGAVIRTLLSTCVEVPLRCDVATSSGIAWQVRILPERGWFRGS